MNETKEIESYPHPDKPRYKYNKKKEKLNKELTERSRQMVLKLKEGGLSEFDKAQIQQNIINIILENEKN